MPTPLQLLNSPPTTAITPTATSHGGELTQGNTSTGQFNFGGASLTNIFIIGGIVAAVYFLRKK